jgi:hypothetical protein
MKKFLFLGVLAFLLASCSSDSQSESGFSQVHFVEPGTAIVAHKEFRLNQEGAYTFEVSTQNPPPNPIDPNVYGLTLSYKIHVNGKELRKEELSYLGSPWWGLPGRQDLFWDGCMFQKTCLRDRIYR